MSGEGRAYVSTDLLKIAHSILKKYALCDYCLGRQFAKLLPGLGNRMRGETIKLALAMDASLRLFSGDGGATEVLRVVAENGMDELAGRALLSMGASFDANRVCEVCGGRLGEEGFKRVAEDVVRQLEGYEFSSFVVGARVPVLVMEREDGIKAEFGITFGEGIKSDIKREVGKVIQSITGKKVDFNSPDVVISVDIFSSTMEVRPSPLFVKGKYRKLVPSIPQSPWLCRVCWGRGCESCGFSGKEYKASISELIGEPALKLFGAVDYKFHAAGREDVNALVLGTGRPFILELKLPRLRFVDLEGFQRKVNELSEGMVEIFDLSYATRKDVREIKARSSVTSKTYLVLVEFDSEVEDAKLEELCRRFRNVIVSQRTPTRVLRRRGDRVRKKYVYHVGTERKGSRLIEFRMKVQGGLYVKELIDGDSGRTVPSFAELLGTSPVRINLTVIEVE